MRVFLRKILRWIFPPFGAKFYVTVHEPMGETPAFRPIKITKVQSLVRYFEKEWFKFERITINGKPYDLGWEYYIPSDGDRITLFPCVETKMFSNAYIAKINAESEGGVLLKTVIVTEDPNGPVLKYYVDHDEAIVIDGNTYQPLPMRWDGYEMSGSMSMPTMKISTHNLGEQVSDYVEELDILDNDVVVQLVHLDLLGDLQARDSMTLQIQTIESDDLFITFNLGLNLGFSDLLPRGVITKEEFPGVVDDTIRF
jgi:hypothetical protein